MDKLNTSFSLLAMVFSIFAAIFTMLTFREISKPVQVPIELPRVEVSMEPEQTATPSGLIKPAKKPQATSSAEE